MDEFTEVQFDVAEMAEYWRLRPEVRHCGANEEFERIIEPMAYLEGEPSAAEIMLLNMCYTEWLLFERPMPCGLTPLELYVREPPAGVDPAAIGRLRQVAQSHRFSRYAILDVDERTSMAELHDVRTGDRLAVLDRLLCANRRWRRGTIAERVACVDGVWQLVGQVHLYDVAPPEATSFDGPGEVHPDDGDDIAELGYFMRMVHDVMGVTGRYTPTRNIREYDVSA